MASKRFQLFNNETSSKNYVQPKTKILHGYAECAGIKIGSGDTTPEECDSNSDIFEEEITTQHKSIWGD